MRPPAVFAVTGGPCSGKTTGLSHLHREGVPGHAVFSVPEAATLYHDHGARVPFGMAPSMCGRISTDGRNTLWEMLLNELKRSLEARTINRALAHQRGSPAVVLCDRGIFDSRAYLPSPRAWSCMLALAGWEESALTSRYDHVFHMALCPEASYNLDNNKARRETFAEAAALDGRTLAAWQPTHASAHTLVGADLGPDSFGLKLDELAVAVERNLDGSMADKATSAPLQQFHLPPREIIALADTVASAPDLSSVAPTAVHIVRSIERVGRLPLAERAFPAERCHRLLRRSLGRAGFNLGYDRDLVVVRQQLKREVEDLLASPAW